MSCVWTSGNVRSHRELKMPTKWKKNKKSENWFYKNIVDDSIILITDENGNCYGNNNNNYGYEKDKFRKAFYMQFSFAFEYLL